MNRMWHVQLSKSGLKLIFIFSEKDDANLNYIWRIWILLIELKRHIAKYKVYFNYNDCKGAAWDALLPSTRTYLKELVLKNVDNFLISLIKPWILKGIVWPVVTWITVKESLSIITSYKLCLDANKGLRGKESELI